MIVIGMKIMDNSKARQVGRERTPEGSHLGKFTQYSPGWYSSPPHTPTHTQNHSLDTTGGKSAQKKRCPSEALLL